MTALSKGRARIFDRWTHRQFPLAVGNKAWKGGQAAIDLSTGKVEPAHAELDLFLIGTFDEDIDATSAEALVNVNLGMEIEVEWLENDGSVLVSQVGNLCYALDDQTVSINGAGKSVSGRVWAVESQGVAVQHLPTLGGSAVDAPAGSNTPTYAAPAYVSNELIIPASAPSGVLIGIPATTGASTVTLPAAPDDGDAVTFFADGIANGHTVQYRDATGPVLLTTALTASKRHLVFCRALGGKWAANAYVSP
jgi:hypothetical protein